MDARRDRRRRRVVATRRASSGPGARGRRRRRPRALRGLAGLALRAARRAPGGGHRVGGHRRRDGHGVRPRGAAGRSGGRGRRARGGRGRGRPGRRPGRARRPGRPGGRRRRAPRQERAVTGGRRAVVFWTATGLIGLDTLLFTMVAPALPVFAEREGFGDAVAALIFAAYPVGQLIAGVGAAGPVERIGRRPLLIAGPFALSLATLAFAVAGDPAELALARFAQGIAAGVVWASALAAI